MKSDVFNTKVLKNGKVYLSGKDVAKALGYKSCKAMEEDGIPTTKLDGVSGKWILEAEYNALIDGGSLELTVVKELRTELQSNYRMAGLVAALTGTKIDMNTVHEKAMETLDRMNKSDESYQEEIERVRKYQELIKDTGLTIVPVTMVSKYNGSKSLRTYLCGEGIFRSIWIDKGSLNYFNWEYEDDNGNLIKCKRIFVDENGDVRLWDEDGESQEPLNLTQTRIDGRNYADFTIEENTLYLLNNYARISQYPGCTGEFLTIDTGAISVQIDTDLLLQMVCGNLDDTNQTLYINGIL